MLRIKNGVDLKEYSTFKETTYVNICTNETTKIPMSITGYFVIVLLISCIIFYYVWVYR